MAWNSKTFWFGAREMQMMESATAEELIPPIKRADPLVALRLLQELHLNGDDAKLRAVLSDEGVRAHWRRYEPDRDTDDDDRTWAAEVPQYEPAA